MKSGLLFATALVCSTVYADPHLAAPSDPYADYSLVSIDETTGKKVAIIKRVTSDRITYSKQIFDCTNNLHRLVAVGRGVEDLGEDGRYPWAYSSDGYVTRYLAPQICSFEPSLQPSHEAPQQS